MAKDGKAPKDPDEHSHDSAVFPYQCSAGCAVAVEKPGKITGDDLNGHLADPLALAVYLGDRAFSFQCSKCGQPCQGSDVDLAKLKVCDDCFWSDVKPTPPETIELLHASVNMRCPGCGIVYEGDNLLPKIGGRCDECYQLEVIGVE